LRRSGAFVISVALASVLGMSDVSAQSDENTTRKIDLLTKQVTELQRQLEELRDQQQQSQTAQGRTVPADPRPVQVADQQPQAQPVQQATQAPQQPQTRPRHEHPGAEPAISAHSADAEPKPPVPAFEAGPVTVVLGGFTELATIYRNRNETADVGSNFNTAIPFPSSPNYHVSEFRQSARQSRLSILAQGPHDENSAAEAYFEMDFLGAAPTANSIESNSYNLRLRHAYGTYTRKDWGLYMLAGQNWSLATFLRRGLRGRSEQIPLTIDAQYVPGFNWTRNAQLRVVKELSEALSFGVSLESPQALIFNGPNPPLVGTVFNNPGGSLFSPTNNYSLDVAPDVIAKVSFDPAYGHYELYGLVRWFRDRAGERNDTVTGAGAGGGAMLPLTKKLELHASFLVGDGIGRYGTTQLPDVTLRPDGRLAKVSGYDVLVGLEFRATHTLSLYTYAGIEHADDEAFTAVVDGRTLGFGYGSNLYDNSGCLIEGSTLCAANTRSIEQATLGGWWKYYEGELGNLQFGFQGSYTRRRIFDGIGGRPSTNLTTGLLSFRYYPYQK